ncbi:hypothetical protein CTAYLR_001857 [Chrysophaeum taylorii]|uniref:Rab-GAP TBC domain-containing protein n=1 Tax=Chrysophaeum taylorii TaxID=2483200 RepID=A0AAD7XJ32_9STRA|nr:hypothetical protein CTAYLR_001857 [Chrysophaeum taylorii]
MLQALMATDPMIGFVEEDDFSEMGDETAASSWASWPSRSSSSSDMMIHPGARLRAVVEKAKLSLASVESRAARAVAHVRRVIDDEMDHVRRIIDDEVDRMRSLRLRREDVDAKRRSLHFLGHPTRETTMEAAQRMVRWLRREAELLAIGFSDESSDGDASEISEARRSLLDDLTAWRALVEEVPAAPEEIPVLTLADRRRAELSREALCETPGRVLHRVYVLVGDARALAKAAFVCRAFRDRTDRDAAGRLLWKWTLRHGTRPKTGTRACRGLWLSLAAAARDDFDFRAPGLDDLVLPQPVREGQWRAQIAVDAARTPLSRLWRGLAVPEEEATTFDQLDARRLKPYRSLVARVCDVVASTHPRLGYCQGVDYVVAYALRATCLDPDDAHLLVATLLDSFDLAGLFEPGLPSLKKRCLELGLLLEARCPDLAHHLANHGVQMELFAAAWIQTLFVYVDALPLDVLDLVWTLLLFERSWKIVHRLALAIFVTLEPHVLRRCHAPHETLLFISQLTTADRPARRATTSGDDVQAVDLFFDDDDAKKILRCAMNIKVTRSMLARIGANELLPKPLRARVSATDDDHHGHTLTTIARR